ncbi:hypothetical protein SPW_7339 [Streptomyces sp. W007]|uniref:hypothetical protein n=1 Tax=Streptomyces sp. W007 TaxID=1055352 RepID=UPI000241A77A|nr:hypothetical protein [Streptomyces sp. W007]EHM24245.1 hypothetical protein SPW_7339 [Streptomyces sp. W007]
MSRINITPRFVLDFIVGRYYGQVEVVTKDIGATIGTEILSENGVRICSYRPGTRHPDRAQEIAEEHLREALEMLVGGSLVHAPGLPVGEAVAVALRHATAAEQKWTPGDL